MNYRNFYPDTGAYKNYDTKFRPESSLKSSAEEFTPIIALPKVNLQLPPVLKESFSLKPSLPEFIPATQGKGLNASASDFKPLTKANLNSEAPIFEIEKPNFIIRELNSGFKPEKINEFVPETLPDEKLDEPIFVIHNRELAVEDLLTGLKQVFVKVDVKNLYSIEEILAIYKEARVDPGFERISETIKEFGTRTLNIVNNKKNKKNKENFKASADWREAEVIDIIATTVWRKPKTEEEEKISSKAKMYKMKLTGSKEDQEKIKRSIKSTMNKVLPTNLNKLREQLLETGKQSTNNLIFLVQSIFEKAWSEVKYTEMYANLCKFLKEKFEGYCFPEMEHDHEYGKRNLFKYELLERCQNAFTQGSSEEFLGLTAEEVESKKELAKKRTLGNVRFIGELFKVGLITTKVILQCVDVLISRESLDEGKLEGACILLSTGGSSFERSKVQRETEKIFKIIEEILKTESLSSKIKFKIMDLIDERNNQWKKNFKEEVKTIQEIHQEFEQEMKRKRLL